MNTTGQVLSGGLGRAVSGKDLESQADDVASDLWSQKRETVSKGMGIITRGKFDFQKLLDIENELIKKASEKGSAVLNKPVSDLLMSK